MKSKLTILVSTLALVASFWAIFLATRWDNSSKSSTGNFTLVAFTLKQGFELLAIQEGLPIKLRGSGSSVQNGEIVEYSFDYLIHPDFSDVIAAEIVVRSESMLSIHFKELHKLPSGEIYKLTLSDMGNDKKKLTLKIVKISILNSQK